MLLPFPLILRLPACDFMKCPICKKTVQQQDNPYRPFCSERCKLLDFGNWADGNYAVPAHDEHPSLEEVDQQLANDRVPERD